MLRIQLFLELLQLGGLSGRLCLRLPGSGAGACSGSWFFFLFFLFSLSATIYASCFSASGSLPSGSCFRLGSGGENILDRFSAK